MADIQLPESVLKARAMAAKLGVGASELKSAEPAVSDVLRQKVQEAYSENQDVIQPLDKATAAYYSAPAAAREKYQNIFNPFQRESLVSQYTQAEALPMLSYSSIYGNRMGRVEDLIGAGTRAFQTQVSKAASDYEMARQNYQDLLSEYLTTEDLARQQRDESFAREKFEWEKKQPRGGGGGTLAERLEPTYQKAINAARSGATLSDMQKEFGSKLGTEEVVKVYGSSSIYGEPQESYARKILGLPAYEEEQEEGQPWWRSAANFFGIY